MSATKKCNPSICITFSGITCITFPGQPTAVKITSRLHFLTQTSRGNTVLYLNRDQIVKGQIYSVAFDRMLFNLFLNLWVGIHKTS